MPRHTSEMATRTRSTEEPRVNESPDVIPPAAFEVHPVKEEISSRPLAAVESSPTGVINSSGDVIVSNMPVIKSSSLPTVFVIDLLASNTC